MANNKVTTLEQAIALIRDNDVVTTSGFVQSCIPEALHMGLEKRFVETGHPKNLTLIMTAGAGDSKGLGTGRLHHEGLLGRVIAGNFGRMPKVAQAAQENKILGYNLPQGVISQLYRACAAGQPGLFSKVGLYTYVDPRFGGAKVNDVTTEDIVKYHNIQGEEWLFYIATKIDVAFIRGTIGRPLRQYQHGEGGARPRQSRPGHGRPQQWRHRHRAGRAHRRAGVDPAQGRRSPRHPGRLRGRRAETPELHRMNYGVMYNPALSGEIRVPVEGMAKMPLDERKVIARRAAFELPPNGVVNLGVGAPEGIAAVANEEKFTPYITLTTEAGAIGGVLASGSCFGGATNADSIIQQNQQFDFYDGGGLDMTCLGMAECDVQGNVNTSEFGGRLNGCGGFINISQNARSVVFAGTFTNGGLDVAIEDGKVKIVKEGRNRKFLNFVEQITFSGKFAQKRKQPVIYVTERCVFRSQPKGLELIEVAPGIDIEKDILAHMDFKPIINEPESMDRRLFIDEPMELLAELLNLNMHERVQYDPERNILFVNLEGWHARTKKDVDELRKTLVEACQKVGKRVTSVVNHDGAKIAEPLYDDYAEMIQYMMEHYYSSTARYATSAFARLKMKEAMTKRGLSPHVFERKEAAQAFLEVVGE